jgi:hypothetical protein
LGGESLYELGSEPRLRPRAVRKITRARSGDVVKTVARLNGKTVDQVTVQDINLIIDQAKFMGELAERP